MRLLGAQGLGIPSSWSKLMGTHLKISHTWDSSHPPLYFPSLCPQSPAFLHLPLDPFLMPLVT
jgi:hypothetical protein